MKKALQVVVSAVFAVSVMLGAAGAAMAADGEIVVYSGRSKSFMDHLLNAFEADTGIKVKRVYGSTAEIALKLQTEGERTPADVFLAQDAGALGALSKAGLLAELPTELTSLVDSAYVSAHNDWVATSLRARTLAYSPKRVSEDELPASVYDLTKPQYKGRVGWSPANASFQAFVTAMRVSEGDAKTRQWLEAMKANGAKSYPRNTAIIQAIAAGEVDLGLPNHYYLIRFKIPDSNYPVEQTHFAAGDIGNMVNVAGAGVLKNSDNKEAARKLIAYLLSDKGQHYFVGEIYEYPVVDGVIPHRQHGNIQENLQYAPKLDLNTIDDLNGTLEMLRDLGLL